MFDLLQTQNETPWLRVVAIQMKEQLNRFPCQVEQATTLQVLWGYISIVPYMYRAFTLKIKYEITDKHNFDPIQIEYCLGRGNIFFKEHLNKMKAVHGS